MPPRIHYNQASLDHQVNRISLLVRASTSLIKALLYTHVLAVPSSPHGSLDQSAISQLSTQPLISALLTNYLPLLKTAMYKRPRTHHLPDKYGAAYGHLVTAATLVLNLEGRLQDLKKAERRRREYGLFGRRRVQIAVGRAEASDLQQLWEVVRNLDYLKNGDGRRFGGWRIGLHGFGEVP